MKRKSYDKRGKISLVLFGAGLLCLCLLSAKLTLVVLAAVLIGIGIRLLKC